MGSKSAVPGAFPVTGRLVEFALQRYVQGQIETQSNISSDYHDRPFNASHHNESLLTNSKPIRARSTRDDP